MGGQVIATFVVMISGVYVRSSPDEAPVTNTVCATTEEYCAAEHWTTLTCTYLGSAYGAVLVSNIITIVASIYRAKAEVYTLSLFSSFDSFCYTYDPCFSFLCIS